MNILIKLTSIVALIIAPHINANKGLATPGAPKGTFENMPGGSSDAYVAPERGNNVTAQVNSIDLGDRF
jgi:hypothetical protein